MIYMLVSVEGGQGDWRAERSRERGYRYEQKLRRSGEGIAWDGMLQCQSANIVD